LSLVFERLDELSSQLKNKIAEDAKVSQQALFAESAGLNALKDSIASLQTEVSLFKSHDHTSQSDIRSLLADHVVLWKESAEKHARNTKAIADDMRSLCKDVEELRENFEALSGQCPRIQQDLTALNDNMSGVHSSIETLRSKVQSADLSILGIEREIHGQSRFFFRWFPFL
jgi:chromosome segregation ATPase